MKYICFNLFAAAAFALLSAAPGFSACPQNMVESGSTCIDKYEASIWRITNFTSPVCTQLISQLKAGAVPPLGTLTFCGQEVGIAANDFGCGAKGPGAGCTNIFALPLVNRQPARTADYFTAAAACRNSGKRLPSNAEWQAAALGTPEDPTPPEAEPPNYPYCHVTGLEAVNTGSRSRCVSDVGAYDMVGNVVEWVGDWGPVATAANNWMNGDATHVGGVNTGGSAGLPGGTIRGGTFTPSSAGSGVQAGVYAIDQNGLPTSIGNAKAAGFRCAK